MFTFTPLLGAQSESLASQSLLELDGGVKVLVDVGWDEAFDVQKLEALEKHVSTLSIILLTHPTLDHIGAYAHCCKHIPLFSKIPAYATTPVINLGRTLLNDLYTSSPLAASIIPIASISSSTTNATDDTPNLLLDPPTIDDIASYFSLINPLKYSQPHQPIPSSNSPSLNGLTITAYGAGHTLGGTIWHIQHGLESIVYAADWNQGRENLFSGAAWLSGGSEIIEPLRRPTALICSSKGVENSKPLSRKKRDDTLISLIRETIAQGGKVLIPTDSSARVLELAYILNQTWRDNIDGPHADTYKNTRIYMASKSSKSSVRFLNSMLEWLDDAVRGEAEAAMTKGEGKGQAQNGVSDPLDWKFVKQLEKRSQVEKAVERSKPCVLLASDASMDWGFSKQALQTLANDSRNLVIMTEKSTKLDGNRSILGRQLWDIFDSQLGHTSPQSGAKVVNADGSTISVRDASTSSLNPEETALYRTYIARQQQLHSTLSGDNSVADPTGTAITEEQEEEDSDSSDEDEDIEHQGRALNISAQLTQSSKRKVGLTDAELGVNVLLRGTSVFDYDVRNKRGREKMFPFVAHRNRNDDYGDLIKPEDYLRAEERDEIDGVDMREGGKNEGAVVGLKRKWDDGASAKGRGNGRPQQNNKRQKQHQQRDRNAGPDDIDAAIARATGQFASDNLTAQPLNNSAAAEDDESIASDASSDYEPEDSSAQDPQKLVFETRTLELKCRIAYVDFAGLHELRDLQMLVPLIRPRKLVLIAGSASETELLATECRRLLAGGNCEVFAPQVGEVVDASVDTNAWTLRLGRELVRRLVWQNVKGVGVVGVTGRLVAGEVIVEDGVARAGEAVAEENVRKKMKLIKGEDEEDDEEQKGDLAVKNPPPPPAAHAGPPPLPTLDLLPTIPHPSTSSQPHQNSHAIQPPAPIVHVGDLRLASLRQLLSTAGHTCEFRGEGTLLVDGSVVVRKSADGRVEVEGGLAAPGWATRDRRGEGSFFEVRRAVYGGLALVGGV